MKKGNPNAVVGVFYTRSEAEQAIRDLRIAGFSDDKIGMVARDSAGRMVSDRGETMAEEGAAAGAVDQACGVLEHAGRGVWASSPAPSR